MQEKRNETMKILLAYKVNATAQIAHLQFARANAQSKNCKRVCLANAWEEMKLVANLKDKMTENKECQCLAKAIRNLGNVLILKIIALNKISCKLII